MFLSLVGRLLANIPMSLDLQVQVEMGQSK